MHERNTECGRFLTTVQILLSSAPITTLSLNICIHTYICIYTLHIHINIHIYWHAHIHTQIHAYSYIYIHTYTCAYTYTYMYTYIHRYIWAHIHKHTTVTRKYLNFFLCMTSQRQYGNKRVEGENNQNALYTHLKLAKN